MALAHFMRPATCSRYGTLRQKPLVFYSLDCREEAFSKTHIPDRENLSNATGAKHSLSSWAVPLTYR
jgi:hypothetical protein